MGSEPFRIEQADHSLVVTFDRPSNVLSWLPLHGGFRTRVSHFLVRQFTSAQMGTNEETLLRQAAGRLRLKGTVVRAATTTSLHGRRTSKVEEDDLLVAALALLPVHGELLNQAKITGFFRVWYHARMRDFVILFIHLIVVSYPARLSSLCSRE